MNNQGEIKRLEMVNMWSDIKYRYIIFISLNCFKKT